MADLPRPEHLQRVHLPRHAAALAALVLGALSLLVALVAQKQLWATPDPRITVPGFGLTAAAAIASLVRHERAYPWWLVGLGLAGSAVVLGWFLMLALIAGVTAIVILILHTVL